MNEDTCECCGQSGFPDFIIPYEYWIQISPAGDECGLFCPNCIIRKLHDKGLRCNGALMSGPVQSVTADFMSLQRDFENLKLAIYGRANSYGVALAERVKEAPKVLARMPAEYVPDRWPA
jgi:hypothetical protein